MQPTSFLLDLESRIFYRGWGAFLVAVAVAMGAPPSFADQVPKSTTYLWSGNRAIEPAVLGRQRAEPALATDSKGTVWLSFLDADYHQLPNNTWIAWPRKVPLYASTDEGMSFKEQEPLSITGGDETLTPNPAGGILAAWIQYGYDAQHRLKQQAMLRSPGQAMIAEPSTCLLWDDRATAHDQTHIYIGSDSVIRFLAVNIHPLANPKQAVYYARWDDAAKQCKDRKILPAVGGLPQLAATRDHVLVVGPMGYLISRDNGATFRPRAYRFANKLARTATSPDGQIVYVVGDSVAEGLMLYMSDDGGESWRRSRIDDGGGAVAWRFPAIHVEASGRVHVIWMDDRNGSGALYHAYSDTRGRTFSRNTKISDTAFPFPKDAPPPPPSTQNGTWVGDYIALTSVHGKLIAAWSDQRAGMSRATIYVSVGEPQTE